MSRIGRQPIAVPAGVTVTIAEGNVVTVKGPLGELTRTFNENITIAKEGDNLVVSRPNDEKENRALHGLSRTLLNNMVVGVKDGFAKKLEIVGVGYRVEKQGAKIVLGLGYSHPVIFEEKDGIKFECPDSNTLAEVGLGRSLGSDNCCYLTNSLLIDTLNDNGQDRVQRPASADGHCEHSLSLRRPDTLVS